MDRTGSSLIVLSVTSLRIKWQSSSMCFVRLWKMRLVAMWMVALLSQNNKQCEGELTCKSFSSWCNHMISDVLAAKARYSASVEDRDTMLCFFAFHDTKACITKEYAETCCGFPRVKAWYAQSALENAQSWKDDETRRNTPWLEKTFQITKQHMNNL